MRTNNMSFVRKFLSDERGQTLPMIAVMMVAVLGVGGLSLDVGRAYVARAQLQNATNAAALAAAGVVYNNSSTANAISYATEYSSESSGNHNYNPMFGSVSKTIATKCLQILSGGTCGSGSPDNAVRITQTASVATTFLRLFRINSLSISATATASMLGTAQAWNVAIILDATPSMNATDPYCSTNGMTAEQCAMSGIQTMLKGIDPCLGSATTCSSTSSDAVFRVSLFSFPNVTTDTVAYDATCGGTPTATLYTLPVIPPSGSTDGYSSITYSGKSNFGATYQITQPSTGNADANGFLSDYYKPSSRSGLNSSSLLVKAVGHGNTSGCLRPPTGYPGSNGQTYFAGAIYAAQAALQAEQAAVARLGISSKNAIIFVSDGQANTNSTSYPKNASTASSGGVSVTSSGNSSTNLTGAASSFGVYPDYHDDCQQAIMAAQSAINAGTRFYSVAYGSESSGCVQDSTVVVTGNLNIPITSVGQVIPCVVMEDMASPGLTSDSPWYFYTDGSSVANGCSDTKHTSTNLTSIFGAIASTFTNPRLLPNNAN